MSEKSFDYYYDFSSTNAYFATWLAPEVAARTGARLDWKPFYLGHVFRARGHDVFDHGEAKLAYLWRDHLRWAARMGLGFIRPSTFPIKTSLALRGSVVMREAGREEAWIKAVMSAYWAEDRDIADAGVLRAIAEGLGAEGSAFLEAANGERARAEVARSTDEGIARGAFGAPMFFVGDEMFWGKDRLDFVEAALMRAVD